MWSKRQSLKKFSWSTWSIWSVWSEIRTHIIIWVKLSLWSTWSVRLIWSKKQFQKNLYDQFGQSEQCDQTTDRNNLVSVNNMLNEAFTKKTFMISLVNLSSETRKLKEIIVNLNLWATWSVWLIRWKRQCKKGAPNQIFVESYRDEVRFKENLENSLGLAAFTTVLGRIGLTGYAHVNIMILSDKNLISIRL